MVYDDGKTYIGYYASDKEMVAKDYPDDFEFQDGLVDSCNKIAQLINFEGIVNDQ